MDNSTILSKKKEGFLGQRMIVLPPDSLNEILKNSLIKDFFLTAIGFYPNAKFHDRKRETGSNEYILLYCTEGKGMVIIDNVKLKIKPNQYIIIPPDIPHHYKSSIKNPWSIYWVHFTGLRASKIFYRYSENKVPLVKFVPYSEQRINNFLEIIQILDFSFDSRSLEFANINLIHFLSSFIYQPEIDFNSSEKTIVNNSISFMKKNLHKPLKIEDFADNENLSVSRFSEVFKEKTGYPPIRYFIKMKIQKSCQYLYFTDRSVKEISTLVGFIDPYYFSRIFKKTMGVSPTRYKKNYKK